MKYKKITVGFVIQDYENGRCVSQAFVAGDQVDYENETGDPIEPPVDETYQPFEMMQPGDKEHQIGTRECPRCRRTAQPTQADLAEAGAPYCPGCECDMNPQ